MPPSLLHPQVIADADAQSRSQDPLTLQAFLGPYFDAAYGRQYGPRPLQPAALLLSSVRAHAPSVYEVRLFGQLAGILPLSDSAESGTPSPRGTGGPLVPSPRSQSAASSHQLSHTQGPQARLRLGRPSTSPSLAHHASTPASPYLQSAIGTRLSTPALSAGFVMGDRPVAGGVLSTSQFSPRVSETARPATPQVGSARREPPQPTQARSTVHVAPCTYKILFHVFGEPCSQGAERQPSPAQLSRRQRAHQPISPNQSSLGLGLAPVQRKVGGLALHFPPVLSRIFHLRPLCLPLPSVCAHSCTHASNVTTTK